MGLINYPNQFNFTGKGYLDSKMKTVPNMESLKQLDPKTFFQGYTVVVLDDGSDFCPCEYWLPGNSRKWVKKYDFDMLNLVFDKDNQIIQLQYGNALCGASIGLADLFEDRFIEKAEIVAENAEKVPGNYLKFTYSGVKDEQKVEYLSLPATASQAYKAGEGISIAGDTISLDGTYVDKKIEEKTKTLSSEISKIAGLEKKVTDVEAETASLNDKISKLTGSKPVIDRKSLEYTVVNPETGQEELGVKISKVEGNMLKKEEDGLSSVMMVSGDDTDTEITY